MVIGRNPKHVAGSAVRAWRTAGLLAVAAPAAIAVLPSASATPNPSAAGTATTFQVSCGPSATSATFFASTFGLHDQIPMQPQPHAAPGDFTVTVRLPARLAAGSYRPSFACSNGASGIVVLRVNPVPRKPPPTGDGTTATATDTPLAMIGFAMMGLGALTGGLALRRRAGRRT